MAASMVKSLACRQCIQINLRFLNLACREYTQKRNKSKRKGNPTDPRKNVQYPYVPGDPHHEDLIRRLVEVDEPTEKNALLTRAAKTKARDFVQKSDTFGYVKDGPVKNTKHKSQYGHIYEMIKDGDLRLGKAILKARSNQESETIVLEGHRLIKDAISLGAEIKNLYFSTEDMLKDLSPSVLQDAQIFKILYRDMKIWSDTTTPSGILGIFKKPGMGECCPSEEPRLPLTVILDRVKDPGNVGTLIRTAAAIGCERILVLKGCANVWEGKVLRSGMGAHFAVPIYNGLTWSQVYSFMEESTQVFLADARAEGDVVMGFDKTLSVEQVVDEVSSTDSDDDGDDSSSSSDSEEDDSSNNVDTLKQTNVFNRLSFPVISYSNAVLDVPKSGEVEDVALVIGNETEGLSPAAQKFAYNYYGKYLTVPMSQAVDSLNTAVAGSIILYEIRRKMLELELTASRSKDDTDVS